MENFKCTQTCNEFNIRISQLYYSQYFMSLFQLCSLSLFLSLSPSFLLSGGVF